MICQFKLALYIIVLSIISISETQPIKYNTDCNDPHHKDIVCSVKIVDCDAENDFVPKVKGKQQIPGEAHDLRIEPFAKARPKQKGESYQLSVDISWQTPPENATVHLKGFLLEIEHEKGIERTCFLFNVSETNWTSKAIMSSPRFHFSTDSIFKFDQVYDVTLTSLPEMHNFSRSITKTIKMPQNPSQNEIFNHVAENCTKFSHPFASKWTAGFRQIILHDLARTIQLEFVAAPKQYCFEQYEVRLVDESGLELLHTDIISVENMKTEIIDNSTVYFGEYNFTNLDYGKIYVPSVIPVEKAADGRCLCPVDGTDPYDTKIVCSCVAAEGKPVKLKRIVLIETEISNVTLPSKIDEPNSGIWFIVFILFGSIVIIVCLMHLIRLVYRRYSASGKMVRIRFVQERQMENGNAAGGLLGPSVKAPLILNPNLNILIIYSHDCSEHEKAVIAFAEYLRDVFSFEVHLDQWDQDAIEANMMDYVSASIINADKVIVINSIGANHRYHCKIVSNGYTIGRANPGIFDHMFLTQIDQALQHPFVVSARFPYSSFNNIIPALNGCLQYQVPDNLTQLLSALVGRSLKNDPRLAGYNANFAKLQAAITQMEQLLQKDEKWFDHSHVRVPITVSPKRTVSPYLVTDELPVVSVSKEDVTNLNEHFLTLETDNDSGVFDRNALIPPSSTTIAVANTVEEENIYDNERVPMISDDEIIPSLPEQFAKVPVRNQQECIYSKFDEYRQDTSGDSGLVSDVDLHLISAS